MTNSQRFAPELFLPVMIFMIFGILATCCGIDLLLYNGLFAFHVVNFQPSTPLQSLGSLAIGLTCLLIAKRKGWLW